MKKLLLVILSVVVCLIAFGLLEVAQSSAVMSLAPSSGAESAGEHTEYHKDTHCHLQKSRRSFIAAIQREIQTLE